MKQRINRSGKTVRFTPFKLARLSLPLMVSSLLFLILLQFLWLRNSYEKVYADLRKDSNDIFRATLSAIRDSAVVENMKAATPLDTAGGVRKYFTYMEKIDTAGSGRVTIPDRDVQIIISSADASSDSVRNALRPLMAQIHERKFKRSGTFTFRMRNDTLSVDTLLLKYRKALVSGGIQQSIIVNVEARTEPPAELHGNIMRRRMNPRDSATANYLRTEWMPYDPFHQYAATISSFRPALLRQIAPQILFSAFLTILTATAFFIMYRSLRSQQRLMEMKNDFISNITHELKTPVTTVSVALEALRDFKGLENPQTTREYLDIAQSELSRLTLLTDKILKSAIFENKGIGFDPEPVDLLKTVEQILRSMKLIFDKQKAQVSFERQGDSFMIMGGSVHLTNVIYNLLDNALKYSTGEPRISISLHEENQQLILRVEDKGIGIPTEYRKKIFEKFFRVPTGDVHNVKGYGLGLSYVQAVIQSHRGLIEVNSTPGEGSIFTIFLPKQATS